MLNPDKPVLQNAERSAARQEHLLTLSIGLLRGSIHRDRHGVPHRKYLDESEEYDARRALATLLRSDTPLNRDTRYVLAELFDPDHTCAPYLPNERKLVFKFRDKRRRTDYTRNTAIAQHVFRAIQGGKSWDEAIGDVANNLDLSDGTVRDIWRRYQKRRDLLL